MSELDLAILCMAYRQCHGAVSMSCQELLAAYRNTLNVSDRVLVQSYP